MAVSQLPQTPYRQDRKTFPTPLIGDVLFSEIRDGNRSSFPEYGTPHPDTKKWPHHKLVYVKPVDIERNEIFEVFYAADRENQDLYNFAFGVRNIGGREFRAVTRTYVTLRSKFSPTDIPFAEPMPNEPKDQFKGVDYVFYDKQQQQIGEEVLNSLFVVEARSYVEVAVLDETLTASVERPVILPERFRAALPTVTHDRLEVGQVTTPSLGSGEIAVSEDQINSEMKRVRTVERSEPSTNTTLIGYRAYVEGGTKAAVTETYSTSSQAVDEGLYIVQSNVSPLGDGSTIKETVSVSSQNGWPILKSSEWDSSINAPLLRTEQFVKPPKTDDEFNIPNTSFKAVNKDRSLKIVEVAPTKTLTEYVAAYPTEVNIDLPNILKKVVVVWSFDAGAGSTDSDYSGVASGTSWSLSGSEAASGNGSASIKPEILLDIEQPSGSNIPAIAYFFYVKMDGNSVSSDAFLQRLQSISGNTVNRWPVFKPVGKTIITQGARASVTASASVQAAMSYAPTSQMIDKTEGFGESFDLGLSVNAINIPPTLHSDVLFEGNTEMTISTGASANVEMIGTMVSASASSSPHKTISARVTPSLLTATSPPDIPRSGYYVIRSQVEPYKWGWAKCFAVVVDASIFR